MKRILKEVTQLSDDPPNPKKLHAYIWKTVHDWKRMTRLFIRYNGCIELPFKVANENNVHMGRNVHIGKGARFNVVKNCHLYIGDGTWIGRFGQFAGGNYTIRIGKNVLIAERVYVGTLRHMYEDVTKPVIEQGFIYIGDILCTEHG